MLDGLLVLDLTRHLPGPWATQALCDLGAAVIKVEAPPAGDPVRALPPHDARGVSAAFAALNRGKRSVVVDLKRPGGAALLLDLAARADVLVEGFRPGVLDRLGAGEAAARARNPRLVWCALSGYGQAGPYRDRPGHDLTYQAYTGLLGRSRDARGEVVTPGFQTADMLGASAALAAILAALVERARTGVGRAVEASMLEATLSARALHLGPWQVGDRGGRETDPLGGAFPNYRVYATADGGAFALAALEPQFWGGFCDIVGRPDWVGRGHDPSLVPEVEALFRTRPRDAWRLILETADVCAAPVLDDGEVLSDPQVGALGLAAAGHVAPPFAVTPADPDQTAAFARRAVAAHPGADTRAVLREVLGLGDAAIDDLEAQGVVRSG